MKTKELDKHRELLIAIMSLFLMISFLYINPTAPKKRSEYHSSQLEKVTVAEGNTQKTIYLDDTGKVTIAADFGYAIKLVTRTEEGELEIYLDESGGRIDIAAGYYGILREFDEAGNNVRITFLDIDGKPMKSSLGYAIEEREFNAAGQVAMNRYLDTEGNPTNSTYYGYGKRNEYNEDGKPVRITYLDADGNPAKKQDGYAIEIRTYYKSDGPENGKVKTAFYYDVEEKPIALGLGQYGVFRKYDDNGQEAVLTYLDAEGMPLTTTKGYSTIKRTYHADNSVAIEQYFDIEGNPVSLSEKQYGQKTENGQTIYLNMDGSERFNVKNLMYNQSWFVILFALLAVFISSVGDCKWNIILLVVYFIAVVYMTLMYRESREASAKLELFWSYKKIFTDSGARSDILKNIWLFIPLGAILYKLHSRHIILLLPVILSILIELIQYATGTGICELDDVISNGLGGSIGYAMGSGLSQVLPVIKRKVFLSNQ